MSEEKIYDKPLPEFRPETKPYWDAAKNHKLVIPRSKTTGESFFYPRAFSPGDDMTDDIEWVESSGKGSVWTFSIVKGSLFMAFSFFAACLRMLTATAAKCSGLLLYS